MKVSRTLKILVVMVLVFGVFCITVQAGVIDLLTAGNVSDPVGTSPGAIFVTDAAAVVEGTGLIEPFLRLKNDGTEYGVNTSNTAAKPLDDQDSGGQNWNRAIPLSDMVIVTRDTTDFRTFFLDFNQAGQDKSLLSLDQLMVYVGNSNTLVIDNPASPPVGATLIYNLDAYEDNWVAMDGSINHPGSGSGDIYVDIPNTLFDVPNNDFVYLYCQFGGQGGDWVSNDGFEEWYYLSGGNPPPVIPAPGAILLGGIGVGLVGWLRRRRNL